MNIKENFQSELTSTWRFFARPIEIFRNYRPEYLRPDLTAALTVAIIMLPQAIAFALIAELPPEMGLYGAIIGAIVGGLWGSSSQLLTGPTNTMSLLVLSALLAVAQPNTSQYIIAAGVLALLAGVFHILMGIARLGILVNFVSDSVIVGFTAGAGVLIFAGQLRHLLRLDIPSAPGLTETLGLVTSHLREAHLLSLMLGLGTMILIVVLRRVRKGFPGALVAMVLTSALVAVLKLDQTGVRVVSEIPQSLPGLIDFSGIDMSMISSLLPGALAIAAIGLVQTMSITRVVAAQTRQRLDSNQEFVGQGLANIASGLFSGFACTGSFVRSAVNYNAGAVTPMASVFSGLIALAGMLILAPLARFIPMASLAGVLILAAYGLVDRKEIVRIWRGGHGDRVIMVTTLVATMIIPLEYAVLVGILISLAHYLLKTSTPRVRAVVPDHDFSYLVSEDGRDTCPQLGIVEIRGDLYFGATHFVEEFLSDYREQHPEQRYLLLRLQSIQHCDISGIHVLEAVVRAYRDMGGDVYISRYQMRVLEIMESSGFMELLGEDHFLGHDENAIEFIFYKVIDPAICIYECPVRVFKECQNLAKRLDLIGDTPLTKPPNKRVENVAPKALWDELHADFPPLVVDVREPREFRRIHIPEARSIPLPDLLREPARIDLGRDVVFVCQSGRRSTRAASELLDAGYEKVRVLRGGMNAWRAEKLIEAIDVAGVE